MSEEETFESWLNRCEKIALQVEWCIDPQMPEWNVWFDAGLPPNEAVDRLFDLVLGD